MNNSKKCGFSLAETMIMLVIVAIIMAVSAPLITKKAAADARRLILSGHDGGRDVVVVPANAQTLGIGINNPLNSRDIPGITGENIKLHVNGSSIFNGKVVINDTNTETSNDLFVSNSDGTFGITGNAAAGGVQNTFQFNTKAGTSNIATMPDYSKHIILRTGLVYKAEDNGYLYIGEPTYSGYPLDFFGKDYIKVTIYKSIPTSDDIHSFPSDVADSAACSANLSNKCSYFSGNISAYIFEYSKTDISGSSVISTTTNLIPISKGTYFKLEYTKDASVYRYVPFLKAQSRISD